MVVAGLIQNDGRILIAQRRKEGTHPLKWEFPGGKVERGESPRQALERELREELTIEAEVGPELVRYEYAYPRRHPILLIFLVVLRYQGTVTNQVFERILWERPERLSEYDFLDGDRDLIRRLSRGDFGKLFSL